MRTTLRSLFDLSSLDLQAASWTNPNDDNPGYSFVASVPEPVNDTEYLGTPRNDEVINDSEYTILLRLVQSVAAYSPPNEDCYDPEAMLSDPKWRAVTVEADSVFSRLGKPTH